MDFVDLNALLYGAFVAELSLSLTPEQANEQLKSTGRAIGRKLVDDYAARKALNITSFVDAAGHIEAALSEYIGAQTTLKVVSEKMVIVQLVFNPLEQFVSQMPNKVLVFSNAIGGALEGAFEQLAYKVTVVVGTKEVAVELVEKISTKFKQ